jgi:hypothetical protein
MGAAPLAGRRLPNRAPPSFAADVLTSIMNALPAAALTVVNYAALACRIKH